MFLAVNNYHLNIPKFTSFISLGFVDETLPAVVLSVPDDRPSLWGKSVQAWAHVYRNYLDQADWFYKADDDT